MKNVGGLFRHLSTELQYLVFNRCFTASESRKLAGLSIHLIEVASNEGKTGGISLLSRLQESRLGGDDRPAIVFSFEPNSQFQREYPIVESKGVTFARLPITREKLGTLLTELDGFRLSDAELAEVCRWESGLASRWRKIAHHIGNLLSKYPESASAIRSALDAWADSIERFAPDQLGNLVQLRAVMLAGAEEVTKEDIKEALQILDEGLQIPPQRRTSKELAAAIPPLPPRGFSKVLIADDNPQEFLASTLRAEFRYDVIYPQATKLRQAKDLLDEHDPRVVLADLYFKESDRVTEVPRKAMGEKFIRYATRDDKRLVLVTSKATVRSEDLVIGTINCSGAQRATNASAIHEAIWAAAKDRGITEAESIDGNEWGPELICRQRLEPYGKLLPKLIAQWSMFPGVVKDTLNLTRLLSDEGDSVGEELIGQLIEILQSNTGKTNFSAGEVRELFRRTGEIHRLAKLGPESPVKTKIRNILHGKIEQFSSVSNAVEQMLVVTREVAAALMSIPIYKGLGESLDNVLANYSETVPLSPILVQINETVEAMLRGLPPLPMASEIVSLPSRDGRKIRIVVVEDSPFWTSEILEVCEQLAIAHEGHHEIVIERFDNAAEAAAAIEPRSKTNVIAETGDRIATIAILDICVPKDREHVENIELAESGNGHVFESPESSYGLELIRVLSDFRYNIPIIVFSTIDSVSDRKKVCGWGVPEANFISKGPNAQEHLKLALNRFIEKSQKYVISRHIQESTDQLGGTDGASVFRINGVKIDFPPAIFDTFTALYELCQRTGQRAFTLTDILENQRKQKSEDSIRVLQDHINRIREKVFETAHQNRFYLDVHGFIRTRSDIENGVYGYELNAEIPTIVDEDLDPEGDDLEALPLRNKVLLVGGHTDLFADISEVLLNKNFEIRHVAQNQNLIWQAREFDPDIVIISTDELDDPISQWKSIKGVFLDRDIGAIFVSSATVNSTVPNELVQNGVPLDNVISRSASNWLNDFLQAFENERLRVFVGVAPDLSKELSFPIVEILDGTDFETGTLELMVDGRAFKMKPRGNSVHAKLLGQLIVNPGITLSWPEIEKRTKLLTPPSENDRKTWPSRLRKKIADEWINTTEGDHGADRAKLILESSSDGLRLNVRTLDLRTNS